MQYFFMEQQWLCKLIYGFAAELLYVGKYADVYIQCISKSLIFGKGNLLVQNKHVFNHRSKLFCMLVFCMYDQNGYITEQHKIYVVTSLLKSLPPEVGAVVVPLLGSYWRVEEVYDYFPLAFSS